VRLAGQPVRVGTRARDGDRNEAGRELRISLTPEARYEHLSSSPSPMHGATVIRYGITVRVRTPNRARGGGRRHTKQPCGLHHPRDVA
jgi:hypothetical protein